MRSQGCVNGTLDEANYSSPMPVIGLYVAAATLVCLVFILLDIYAGFREKKRWIPCRFFPLNSVTLTLVAVATKLPVDLTTSMPSAQDQLSKLTGTMLVCIYMGFLVPSLGLTTSSECFSNMVSLTIFVITVFVNICIQMQTGVIFLFRGEHITVLCCMMLLLVTLWMFVPVVNLHKEISNDYIKEQFTNGQGSLLRRLKVCYLHSYDSNPQFVLCKRLICPSSCVICIICATMLVRVTIRSFVWKELEICRGTSDYKWSMWAIVAIQVITILVGCLGTAFRLITMAEHVQGDDIKYVCEGFDDDSSWLQNRVVAALLCPAILIAFLIEGLSIAPYAFIAKLVKGFRDAGESDDRGCFNICKPNDEDDNATKEFKESVQVGEMRLDDWTLKRGVKDMKRWMDPINKINSLNHLSKLLSETPPSQDSLASLLLNQPDPTNQRYKISSLSIVVLTKVATIFISSTLSQSLSNSLDEVLEIIHYIDKTVNSSSFKCKRKSMVSKALCAGKEFRTFCVKPKFEASKSPLQLSQALENISGLKKILRWEGDNNVKEEVATIIDFIEHKSYTSIEELYGDVKQLYVDMLNEFLIQLPGVVFKDIAESPPEDLEERVRFALKIVNKIEHLEDLVQWSFPVGTTITDMIADAVATTVHENRTTPESNSNTIVTDVSIEETPNTENQSRTRLEENCDTGSVLQSTDEERVIHIVSKTTQDEIIQIE